MMLNPAKTVATLTLSACILTGGAASSFAVVPAGTVSAAVLGHQTSTCGDNDNSNGEIIARFVNADGSTSTYTICAEGGEVNGKNTLTKLSNTSANFSGLNVYTGKLDNGEHVMTIACFSAGKAMDNVSSTVWVPKAAVEGYDLYLVNSDGTETKLDVSLHSSSAVFNVNMKDGASLIHMIKTNG